MVLKCTPASLSRERKTSWCECNEQKQPNDCFLYFGFTQLFYSAVFEPGVWWKNPTTSCINTLKNHPRRTQSLVLLIWRKKRFRMVYLATWFNHLFILFENTSCGNKTFNLNLFFFSRKKKICHFNMLMQLLALVQTLKFLFSCEARR